MVEIIKRGTPPSDRKFTVTCQTCSTEFSFLRSEARVNTDRDGTALVIDCPVCKHTCWKAI